MKQALVIRRPGDTNLSDRSVLDRLAQDNGGTIPGFKTRPGSPNLDGRLTCGPPASCRSGGAISSPASRHPRSPKARYRGHPHRIESILRSGPPAVDIDGDTLPDDFVPPLRDWHGFVGRVARDSLPLLPPGAERYAQTLSTASVALSRERAAVRHRAGSGRQHVASELPPLLSVKPAGLAT